MRRHASTRTAVARAGRKSIRAIDAPRVELSGPALFIGDQAPTANGPVTLRELREQANMLARRAGAAREQFAEALASMDYARALASQLELDQLENELSETSSRLYLRAGPLASSATYPNDGCRRVRAVDAYRPAKVH
jgi:hypothetical protein